MSRRQTQTQGESHERLHHERSRGCREWDRDGTRQAFDSPGIYKLTCEVHLCAMTTALFSTWSRYHRTTAECRRGSCKERLWNFSSLIGSTRNLNVMYLPDRITWRRHARVTCKSYIQLLFCSHTAVHTHKTRFVDTKLQDVRQPWVRGNEKVRRMCCI